MLWTKKIYALIALNQYNEEKQSYLNALDEHYLTRPENEKWMLIINQYETIAPQLKRILEKFKTERLQTSVNPFNLSMAACLSYFEHFCFLLTTEHPHYKLSPEQRRMLNIAVEDAIATCETGKNARFEEILQLYRNDETNWTAKALADYRYLSLCQLHEKYNATFNVDRALSVHTLNAMLKLAEKYKLGIKIEHRIEDVYLTYENKRKIKDYFVHHYPPLFNKYEENIVHTLTHHLLSEIANLYDSEHTWEQISLVIPTDCIQAFSRFIENRLGFGCDHNHQPLALLFGEWQENDTFLVKSKKEVRQILQGLVTQKLFNEQYAIDPLTINAQTLKDIKKLVARPQEAWLNLGLEFNQLVVNFDVQHPEKVRKLRDLINDKAEILLQCPDLIVSHFKVHPTLLSLLPMVLKTNPLIIEPSIQHFDALLSHAIQCNKVSDIQQLSNNLSDLIGSNTAYFRNLSVLSQANETLAMHLLKKNILFMRDFPDSLRKNKNIIARALEQNHFAFFYLTPAKRRNHAHHLDTIQAACDQIYEQPIEEALIAVQASESKKLSLGHLLNYQSDHMPQGFLTTEQLIKNQSIFKLLTEDNLATHELVRLTQTLTPIILIKISEWRRENAKPALAHCENIQALQQFNQKLKSQGLEHWCEGYWSVKKEASRLITLGLSQTSNQDPIAIFSRTTSWFLAFASYKYHTHGAFKNARQFRQQLQATLKSLCQLISTFGIMASIAVVGFSSIGFISILIERGLNSLSPGALIGLIVAVSSPLPAFLLNNRPFFLFTLALSGLLLSVFALDIVVTHLTVIYMVSTAIKLPFLFIQWIEESIVFIDRSFRTLFPSYKAANGNNGSLVQQCEDQMAALRMADHPFAHEQAAILEELWEKIMEDAPKGSETTIDNTSLKPLLDNDYALQYQYKKYRVSFNEIAALKITQSPFEMPRCISEQPSEQSFTIEIPFFNKPTTTERLCSFTQKKRSLTFFSSVEQPIHTRPEITKMEEEKMEKEIQSSFV